MSATGLDVGIHLRNVGVLSLLSPIPRGSRITPSAMFMYQSAERKPPMIIHYFVQAVCMCLCSQCSLPLFPRSLREREREALWLHMHVSCLWDVYSRL